eukprot:TRINITY_DN19315_c0_g2_i1.p1 TRINITY_DN19315_c0_g2~~TRINITY_DN19315_c0_g2_i1.p1  ORF type:complete len:617 (+),score=79.62 TRINITY_DN19315_c0_g2_i1:85-1935(+)
MSGGAIADDLLYLLFFWLATVLAAFLAKLTHLSPLVYYLILGMVLSGTRLVNQTHFIMSFSEVAITIVFFSLGLEESVTHFMEGIRKAWGIASIGAIVPFLIGFGCAVAFWPGIDLKVALMCGLAVTATAVSLTMISLKSEGLATSKPAIGIMTSAVLDDIASLALVAICVPIATGDAEPTVGGIAWIVGKSALLFLCIGVAHFIVFPHKVTSGPISYIPGVRSYGIRNLLAFSHGEQATLISLIVGLFFGMVAIWWGFHQTIGAYLAGLILEESYFDLDDDEDDELDHEAIEGGSGESVPKKRNTYDHTLHTIEDAAYCWLGPLFFVNLGASIPIDGEVIKETIHFSLLLFVALFIGQFLSAMLAARFVPGGFTWAESAMIGFGMLGRAELFFVVLNICYNDHDILDTRQFFTFTTTAVLLDISVPIAITLFKPYYDKYTPEPPKKVDQLKPSQTEEELLPWVQNKANRQAMKNERRVFRPDVDLAADLSSRTSSKTSQRSAFSMGRQGSQSSLRGSASVSKDSKGSKEAKVCANLVGNPEAVVTVAVTRDASMSAGNTPTNSQVSIRSALQKDFAVDRSPSLQDLAIPVGNSAEEVFFPRSKSDWSAPGAVEDR